MADTDFTKYVNDPNLAFTPTAASPAAGGDHPVIVHTAPVPFSGASKRGVHYDQAAETDPSTPEWLAHYGPTSGMSGYEKLAAGYELGLLHGARNALALVGKHPDYLEEQNNLGRWLERDPTGHLGVMGGETAFSAPIAGAAGRVASNPLVRNIIEGATQGVTAGDPEHPVESALLGAGLGGVSRAGEVAGRTAVQGMEQTPEAARVAAALPPGTLTPGQLNPKGVMAQLEASGKEFPVARQVIEGAQDDAQQRYREAILQHAAAPGTVLQPQSVPEMLQAAYDSYRPLYDQGRGFPVSPKILNTAGPDIKLGQAFNSAVKTAGVSPAEEKRLGTWLSNKLLTLKPNSQGLLDSGDLLDLRSDLRARARDAYTKAQTLEQHDVAGAYSAAEDAVTRALESQLPQDALTALRTADTGYRNYKVIEAAVAKAKDRPGGFTPKNLSQAIYDVTADSAYARGAGGPLRDLAAAGQATFDQPAGSIGSFRQAVSGALAAPIAATQTGRALAAGQTGLQQRLQALQARTSAPWSLLPNSPESTVHPDELLRQGIERGAMAPYLSPEQQHDQAKAAGAASRLRAIADRLRVGQQGTP